MTLKIIGHRGMGTTHHMPVLPSSPPAENTLAAFSAAMAAGADGVEFDVHLTKDNQIAVVHNLSHLSDIAAQPVESFTLDELQRHDPAIPSLTETLTVLARLNKTYRTQKGSDLIINIELKGKGTTRLLAAAIQDAVARDLFSKQAFVIAGQDWDELRDLRQLDAALHLAPTVSTTKIFHARDIEIPGYNIAADAVPDPALLQALEDLHRDITCYALDAILQDMTPAMIDFLAARQIGLIGFIVPQRRSGDTPVRLFAQYQRLLTALPCAFILTDTVVALTGAH